ncbi:MAG: hypothetical protein V4486_03055 [Patescibacteria group bacterium]
MTPRRRITVALVSVVCLLALFGIDLPTAADRVKERELAQKFGKVRSELERVKKGDYELMRIEKRNNEACFAYAKYLMFENVLGMYDEFELKPYDVDQRLSRELLDYKGDVLHDAAALADERLQDHRVFACSINPTERGMIKALADMMGFLDETGHLRRIPGNENASVLVLQEAYRRALKPEVDKFMDDLVDAANDDERLELDRKFDVIYIEAVEKWGLTKEEVLR